MNQTDYQLQAQPGPGHDQQEARDSQYTISECTRELTLASVWGAVAGGALDDELLAWPPDLFGADRCDPRALRGVSLRALPTAWSAVAARPHPGVA